MKNLTEDLNLHFNIVIQSISDREFYQALYYYYDFFHKTPELMDIFNESQKEYALKHSKLWEKRPMTDKEADEASAQTYKLEAFNLYAVGATILVRIYWIIDNYRNTTEPDIKQDPSAVMLMKGVDYAKNLIKEADSVDTLIRWNKSTFKGYNSWFLNKRALYEAEFRRFHLIFLEEIIKRKRLTKKMSSIKNNFVFDIKTGQFRYKKTIGILSPESKEYRFVKTLYLHEKHQCSYKELSPNGEVSKITKLDFTETVKSVKRKLGILPKEKGGNPDIIKNVSKYGYKLDV